MNTHTGDSAWCTHRLSRRWPVEARGSDLNLENGPRGDVAPEALNVRQNAASQTPPLPDLGNPSEPFQTSCSSNLNVPRNESPLKMRALTQPGVELQRLCF